MRTLQSYLVEYSSYHKNPINKRIHYISVPLIMITLLGLLIRVPLGPLNFGVLLILGSMLFYLMLDLKTAFLFFPMILISYWLANEMSLALNGILFALCWILQGVGHYVYEKRSPNFLKNVEQLLIAPLWIFLKFIGRK